MACRIIARLDIKGPNLVKGIHLEGLRVLGSPQDFARLYYEQGVDELVYMDVVASLYGRNSLTDFVARTARETFIPLTVGGGIRTLEDIRSVLLAGADKVCINTAAIQDPEFLRSAARRFGSSTLAVAIEALKQPDGHYLAYTDNGREYTGLDAIQWARTVEELGAGEIFLTSINREGTGTGFDLDLVREVAGAVSIPVVPHGGCGKREHIKEVLEQCQVDSVCLASILHYGAIESHRSSFTAEAEGNIDFLRSGRHQSRIQASSIPEIKSYLNEQGISIRPVEQVS